MWRDKKESPFQEFAYRWMRLLGVVEVNAALRDRPKLTRGAIRWMCEHLSEEQLDEVFPGRNDE